VEALLTTAGRFGEVTALQPRDLIHPTARDPLPRLQIRRAWKRNEEGEYYLGTTKGRQRRQSAIDNDLFQMLLGLAADKAPDDLLFTAPRGGRIEYQNFLNRVWNPTIIAARRCPAHPPPPQASPLPERVGVCGDYGGIGNKTGKPCQKELARGLDRCAWHTGPVPTAISDCDCSSVLHRRPSIHDLRHTCTAWLFADPTVGPLYVSRYLGHASMEVTDKVYAGLVPHGEGAAVIAIAKARGKGSQTPKAPASQRKKTRINAARAESSNVMRRGRRSAA
jgi:integrase